MKAILKPKLIISLLLFIIAALMPVVSDSSYYQSLFVVTFIWIIVNQGFNIILGYTGYCSLVQGGLFGMAAYIAAILSTTYSVNPWVAAIIAIIAIGLVSWLLALVVFRTDGQFFAILTMVMALVLYELYSNLGITNGTIGISQVPTLFPASWPAETFYYFTLLIMLLSIAFAVWLGKTRLGYGMKGIGANEKLAASIGISLYSHKTAAFVLSSLFAAVAGVLYAYFLTYVSPAPFGVTASLSMLLAVVIGGTGTILGPILGSILLVFLPAWMQSLQDYQLTIYGLVTILMIRFMPRGLVGIGDYFKRSKKITG